MTFSLNLDLKKRDWLGAALKYTRARPFMSLNPKKNSSFMNSRLLAPFIEFVEGHYLRDFIKGPAHITYHVAVIVLSAAAALSLPYTAGFIANKFLAFWSLIENEKVFLISIEIACAVLLILSFNYIGRSLKDRKLANAARRAGVVSAPSRKALFAQKRIKALKEEQGISRDIMVIGSTGLRTFVNPKTDLHKVIKQARKAKIVLLNPLSEGAIIRATSIPDPDVTIDQFREQIKHTIEFLKGLNGVRKNVRLKLYSDAPLLKLSILGDYIWMQQYHAGMDVKALPEYVFEHKRNSGGLYAVFYQYFLNRWNDPKIPEYDFDTEELIYRDKAGNGTKREKFNLDDYTGA